MEIGNFKDSVIQTESDFYIKIGDYFNLNYETNNTVGELSSISSAPYMQNDTKRIIGDCRQSFGQYYDYIGFEHLLHISYEDESKEVILRYYKIDAFNVTELSKDHYEEIRTLYQSHNVDGQKYLNVITAKGIFSLIHDIFKNTQ